MLDAMVHYKQSKMTHMERLLSANNASVTIT